MDFLSSLAGASKPTYSQTLTSNSFFTPASSSSSSTSPINPKSQIVEQEFLDPSTFMPFPDDFIKCEGCNAIRADIWKCLNCHVFLCILCKFGHQQDHLTKNHHLIFCRLRRHYNSGSLSSSSTESCSPPLPSPYTNIHYCDIHAEPHRLYCETCIKTSCASCAGLTDSCQHRLIYVHEAIDKAKKANICHQSEIDSIIREVKECIQKADINKVNNEKAHKMAQLEVEEKFRSIQERFASLIQEMLGDKREKEKNLSMHKGKLDLILRKMRNTSNILKEAILSENPWDLIMAKERAVRDIRNFKQRDLSTIFIEDSEVTFMPPGDDLMRRILNPEYRPFPITMNRVIYGVGKTIVKRLDENAEPKIVGEPGGSEGQLCRPWGVCCNRQGQIIVADRSNDRIQIFNPDGSFLRMFGKHGSGSGELNRPAGVAVNPKGQIIVADKDNHRIQIFTITGEFLHSFGRKGSYPGQFSYPWDVACNSKGQIVVSDSRNHRIQLFDENGTYLRRYGTESNSSQYRNFDTPRGVCFTQNDEVIVTDFNNHKLLKLDITFEKTIRYIGCEGTESLQFRRPQGVICDDNGNLIIADSKNDRIQVLDYMGNFLWSIGCPGRGKGELDTPSGICLTPEGRIVTVDFGNNRVQIF